MHLTVCIFDRAMYDKYRHSFDGIDGLDIVYGNIFLHSADCMVTAGNSFGMMDGGIDGHVNYYFDYIQPVVVDEIFKKWRGECPVGAAVMVPVPNTQMGCKYLCYAPTMRTPSVVATTHNAYLATRAALLACSIYEDINHIIMPMLCLGVGRMHPADILHQVSCAWKSFHDPCKPDWFEINAAEAELYKRYKDNV